jgi:hypothetical protein
MNVMPQRLPVGIQDFAKLREEQYVYVDKTEFLPRLLQGGSYFLARPRRFGKSLLLSTLKYAFEGRKDLFQGLWLESFDVPVRPVIRLDFSLLDFQGRSLEISIMESLRQCAAEHGLTLQQDSPKSLFEELIRGLAVTEKVVVLVDEYDKPITDYLLEPEKRDAHQEVLRSLYGVLKPLDPYLHLVMLTGVSKIGKLSLFSDLNNLRDISLDATFATMLGYTRQEIERSFEVELEIVAQAQQLSQEELWLHVQRWYNGYSWDGKTRLYCPFSFMVFLEQKEFKSFWYETGTPTFLLQMIRSAQLDPMQFDSVHLDELTLSTTNVDNLEMASLMFQTGYLTIRSKRSSPLGIRYELGYPNEEVRRAFSQGLLVEYSRSTPGKIGGFSLELQDALIHLNWTNFFAVVNRAFAGIPYEIFPRRESYVHSLMHLMLISTGFSTQSQVQTALGRMDTIVETLEHHLIFEFKIGGSPQAALEQIDEQGYADGLSKPVIKIGVVFDLERKAILDWNVA